MTNKQTEHKGKAPAMPPGGGEDTDQVKQANGGASGSAGDNIRNNPDNANVHTKEGKLRKDAKLNDDPMGRSAAEETADRQSDSLANETTTFTRSYLIPGAYWDEKNYDHGPNKQNLIQEAINNGLRVMGLPPDAQASPAQEGYEDLEPAWAHNTDLIDVDDVVKFIEAEEYDFGVPGRPHVNFQLTYAAEVVPAHLVGAGPTEALSDQMGTTREVVSPRHVGNTGASNRYSEPLEFPKK